MTPAKQRGKLPHGFYGDARDYMIWPPPPHRETEQQLQAKRDRNEKYCRLLTERSMKRAARRRQ